MRKLTLTTLILLFLLGNLLGKNTGEAPRQNQTAEFGRATGIYPAQDEQTHQIGNLYLTITNYGFFGSQRGDDTPTYCITADEEICGRETGSCRPSAEYPGCTGLEYLFMGALWVGAVVGGDTLVSVGEDGWNPDINELFPSYNDEDTLIYRSVLEGDPDAVSEEDFVGSFSDTITSSITPPDHRPIGIKIYQESYAWSYSYANNFVFIDYAFENIRDDGRTIKDLYIGLYIDGDVGHVDVHDYAQDDITGFIENYVSEQNETTAVYLAWLADNDGDPEDGVYTEKSATGAMAVKLLRGPGGTDISSLKFAYNWWISNTDEAYDWGPMMWGNDLGFDGTPEGDINKYKVMSNCEFDYNQTDIGDREGWIDPPASEDDLRDGYDTRFLLSFGPIEVRPNLPQDSLPHITIAFMVGENFHQDPNNVEGPLWEPNFGFDNLAAAAYWVQQIFENDYKGPEPPPAPEFKIVLGQSKATILWKGTGVEDVCDSITGIHDFEGYRIYIAEENIDQYYVPLVQYDKVNYMKVNYIYEIFDSVSSTTGDSLFHYDTLYSDTLLTADDQYDAYLITATGDTESVTLTPKPFEVNNGMPPDTVYEGEDWYYYVIDNLLPGDDKWVVVTAFDYGQPSKELASLECNKTKNSKWFVPSGAPATDDKVRVVPNPYRVDHDYKAYWEHSFTSEWTEYSRKIRFYNLPKKCTIRIFTLDGDLVKELEHDESQSGEMVGAEDWDLISRNDQSIVSGIYIFSVENEETGKIQTGKFVIIK
ncbi:hypothetical protein DRQ33_01885 [bacterium]|nr:MAG: hypothetical protein DRQ33_01885 [bacterium]